MGQPLAVRSASALHLCPDSRAATMAAASLVSARAQQIDLRSCLFLHSLQPLLDALKFCLSPVEGQANVLNQICLV
jgi:hypothetical protein